MVDHIIFPLFKSANSAFPQKQVLLKKKTATIFWGKCFITTINEWEDSIFKYLQFLGIIPQTVAYT